MPETTLRNLSVISSKSNLVDVWDLPQLPFTEFFGEYAPDFPKVDQKLMMCPESGIFQLLREVNPSFLYDQTNYNFRTLTTPKIERELDFFVESSSLLALLKEDSKVLEIGGNNDVMASKLEGRFDKYAICDPILHDATENNIECWGGLIEDNLERVKKFKPSVILGRHVLEHVNSPMDMLKSLLSVIDTPVIFVFEFPNFRLMQKRQRFDAIFHQHLNYFDEYSVERFVKSLGCKLLSMESNPAGSNGGSLVVSFTNDLSKAVTGKIDLKELHQSALTNFLKSKDLFLEQCNLLERTVRNWNGEVVGFGAGLMLATLDYHLNGAVSDMGIIFDDDESKSGISYQNLDVAVRSSRDLTDDDSRMILITSMENQRAIRNRLQSFSKSSIVGFQVN
jgi:hypothetical protein